MPGGRAASMQAIKAAQDNTKVVRKSNLIDVPNEKLDYLMKADYKSGDIKDKKGKTIGTYESYKRR